MKRGTALFVFKTAASALLLYLLSRKISWAEAWEHLREANLATILGAFLLLGVIHWLCAVRWHWISGGVLGLAVCARFTWISQIYALVLPGALTADLAKGLVMSASGAGKGAVIPVSILADRAAGLGVLVLFGEAACALIPEYWSRAAPAIITSLVVTGAGLLVVPWLLRTACAWAASWSLPPRWRILLQTLNPALDGLSMRTWFTALAMSALIHAFNITFYWLVMKAVHMDESWWLVGVYTCALNLAMLLPVSIGGIGLREHLSALLFTPGTAAAGVAFSWLVLLVSVAHGLVGLLWQCLPATSKDRPEPSKP